MAIFLPPELLYWLGAAINSRATLAALCLVSKAFNGIFTPILYRKIRIQDCELQPLLENVAKLPSESHLRFTRELHLGRNIPHFPNAESGDDLDKCLGKMSELVSLAITHSVWELHLCGDGRKALESLAHRGTLQDLTIIATEQQTFPSPLPIFTNLTSLHLERLSSRTNDRLDGLADILITSPNLKHLGLSNGRQNVEFFEELYRLTEAFHKRRIQADVSILRLRSLYLGAGYRPVEVPAFVTEKGRCYLSQLTDLEQLTSLSLDTHSQGKGWVYTPLFRSATRMKEFSASRLTRDALDLLNYLCRANPTTLTSFSFQGPNYMHEEEFFKNISTLISPLPHLNHSWKSLSISQGSTKGGNHYIKDFISHCTSLEYLACPMYRSEIELFKTFLPDLKYLHTLIITKGNFPDHVPRTVDVSAQLDARDKEREEKTKWQPFSAHPEIARVSVDGQRQAKNMARERGERIRKSIAEDLFRASWDAWAARGETDKGNRLKYIGFGYRVYTWMLAGPGEGLDGWRVEQLSLDEARTFREVRKASVDFPEAP